MPKATKEISAIYTTLADQDMAPAPTNNGEAHHAVHEFLEDIPWEERLWTETEIREWLKPEPRTSAAIVALLDRLDLGEWQAMNIPDVVEWLKEQRQQDAVKRGLYWDEN